MLSLSFRKKIVEIVLDVVDKTLGKKFPIIDKATDLFQSHDNKIKDLEQEIEAIKTYLKDSK